MDKGGAIVFLFGFELGFGKRKERRDGRGKRCFVVPVREDLEGRISRQNRQPYCCVVVAFLWCPSSAPSS